MPFDIPTLVTVLIGQMAVLAGILFAVARMIPPSVRGGRDLAVSFGLYALAGLIYPLRPFMPEEVRYLVFNAPIVAAALINIRGLRLLVGERARDREKVAAFFVVLFVIEVFSVPLPDYAARVATMSLVESVTSLIALKVLLRGWKLIGRVPVAVAGFALSVDAVAGFTRGVVILNTFPAPADIAQEPHQGEFLLVHSVSLVTLGLGLLLAMAQRARKEFERSAQTDELTGALTRGAFALRLRTELLRAKRHGRGPAVVLFDLDHFKQINDKWGHAAGDEVLRCASERLRTAFREEDLVGRWGGEEFAVMLPETRLEGAQLAAERALAILRVTPAEWAGRTLRYTASAGVTEWAGSADELEPLVERADHALYRAKAAGRDAVVADSMPLRSSGALPILLGPVPFAT